MTEKQQLKLIIFFLVFVIAFCIYIGFKSEKDNSYDKYHGRDPQEEMNVSFDGTW